MPARGPALPRFGTRRRRASASSERRAGDRTRWSRAYVETRLEGAVTSWRRSRMQDVAGSACVCARRLRCDEEDDPTWLSNISFQLRWGCTKTNLFRNLFRLFKIYFEERNQLKSSQFHIFRSTLWKLDWAVCVIYPRIFEIFLV
jgi:hypothetical protein